MASSCWLFWFVGLVVGTDCGSGFFSFRPCSFCVPTNRTLKLHELYAQWMLHPENSAWLETNARDAQAGKTAQSPFVSRPVQARVSQAPPGSPISRLIHQQLPLDSSSNVSPTLLARPVGHPHHGPNRYGLSPIRQPAAAIAAMVVADSTKNVGEQLHGRDAVSSPASPVGLNSKAETARPNERVSSSLPSSDVPGDKESSDQPGVDSSVSMDDVRFASGSPDVSSEERDSAQLRTRTQAALDVNDGKAAEKSLATGGDSEGDSARPASSANPPSSVRENQRASSLLPPKPVGPGVGDGGPGGKSRGKIGRFYFPRGKDSEERERQEWAAIGSIFDRIRVMKGGSEGLDKFEFAQVVTSTLALPSFFAWAVHKRVLLYAKNAAGAEPMDTPSAVDGMAASAPSSSAAKTVSSVEPMNTTAGAHAATAPTTSAATAAAGLPERRPTSVDGSLVTEEMYRKYYREVAGLLSPEGRLFAILLPPDIHRDYLTTGDFADMLDCLLNTHRGLSFLANTPEFQMRYAETVVERIFFSCTQAHNRRLTLRDIKRSGLLGTLMVVDEEEDINCERRYFSYEHFYVLYCRFWELDTDHDLQIDREDLMRYAGHSLTYRIVDRIFGGHARKLEQRSQPGFMSYLDFIWFCLSEEDKTSQTAIDYWFRCVDMDGDGLITMYDMEYFYKEQLHRMECFGHDPVHVKDILCQLLDMVKPNCHPPHVKRGDLKSCRLAGNFFNVLFNLNKFFALESRDPMQIRQEHASPDLTDWDRFATFEYMRLSAEEECEEDESWDEVNDSVSAPVIGEAPCMYYETLAARPM